MFFVCILIYLLIGIGHWAAINWFTDGSWDHLGWLILYSFMWVILLAVQIIIVFYGTFFWTFTYRRREYSWIGYMKRILECE